MKNIPSAAHLFNPLIHPLSATSCLYQVMNVACSINVMAPKNILAKMQWDVIRICFVLWCLVACAAAKCPPETCGSLNVSYPFWIRNPSCGYPGFQINCKASMNNTEEAPLLRTPVGEFEIMGVNFSGNVIINSTSMKAMSCNRSGYASVNFSVPKGGPYTISSTNKLVVIGCRSNGSFTDGKVVNGCTPSTPYCNSYGYCQIGLPANARFINFSNRGNCGFSTIVDPVTLTIQPIDRAKGLWSRSQYGLRLEWGVGHKNCSAARGTPNYSCAEQAECKDSTTGKGHVCKCRDGYEGNGYYKGIDCTDVNECSDDNECVEEKKGGICQNLPGSYNCSCRQGFSGNGFRNGTGCQSTSSNNVVVPAIIGSVSSVVGVSLAVSALIWCLRRRHMNHMHAKYFQQNGGIQLQQYITSRGGRATLKIYSATELENASKNYSYDMKLGSGGYGTVYKAILPDGIVGAIKKSKKVSDPQKEDDQFINELIILSQINHRNVVKLLGCCLETESPLLVYEFVPNGTLSEHIHSNENILWEIRLRIAIESAEALAYLHSAASQPIFHRDVKSSNILLDNTYTPKVADFGISRLLNAGDTHLVTNVAGTMGYMDPEYFQSLQLTDKSDVYSFGVVLLELLTGLKPLSLERPRDECTLSGLFLSRLNNNRLDEILDVSIMNAENMMQMKKMANLARECLHVEGKRRPSMKEVVEELVWIRGATRRRQSYVGDERSNGNDGNQMHMQIGTSHTAQIEEENLGNDGNQRNMQIGTSRTAEMEEERLVLGGSVASMSFTIGGR